MNHSETGKNNETTEISHTDINASLAKYDLRNASWQALTCREKEAVAIMDCISPLAESGPEEVMDVRLGSRSAWCFGLLCSSVGSVGYVT